MFVSFVTWHTDSEKSEFFINLFYREIVCIFNQLSILMLKNQIFNKFLVFFVFYDISISKDLKL